MPPASPAPGSASANSWYILRFEEQKDPGPPVHKDILYMDNKNQRIHDATRALETLLHQRFGCMGDMDSGDTFRIESLTVPMGGIAEPVEVTLDQVLTFLRDLPQQGGTQKPDLFGSGSNVVKIAFQYVELNMGGW